MDIEGLRSLYINHREFLREMHKNDKIEYPFEWLFPQISEEIDNDLSLYRYAPNKEFHTYSSEGRPTGMYFAPTEYTANKWAKTLYLEREEEQADMASWKLHKYILDSDAIVHFRLDISDDFEIGVWGEIVKVLNYNFRPFNNPYTPIFYSYAEVIVEEKYLHKLKYVGEVNIIANIKSW